MSIHTRLIKFGDDHLTEDLSDTGLELITNVEGLSRLRLAWTGPVRIPLSGKPFEFVKQNTGAGVLIKIKANNFSTSLFDSIEATINASKQNNTDIRAVFTNGPDDVTVDGRAGGEGLEAIEYPGEYGRDNLVKDFTLNFTVSAIVTGP